MTEEQKDKIQPWLCRIAKDKGIDAPNGLDISLAESSFDGETDRYFIRVHDDSFDEDGILAQGITLVFEDSKIDGFIEANKPLHWRQMEEEQAVAIREGNLILATVEALKKGISTRDVRSSSDHQGLWQASFRRKGSHEVRVTIKRYGGPCNDPTGKVRANVSGRFEGPKKQFPPRKDGTLNHEGIAQFVLEAIDEWTQHVEYRAKQDQDYADCRAAVTAVCEKHDISPYSGLVPNLYRKVEISIFVAPEDLDHAVEVLLREGFRQKRSTGNLSDDD